MKNLSLLISVFTVLSITPSYAGDLCNSRPTCEELGFTQTKSACKNKFNTCPFDSDKVVCINPPSIGDIKHSLKSTNHDGWLLCDGTAYEITKYSKLHSVIKTNYGSTSGKFKVPDYRGFFLRGYGTASNLSSYGGTANNSLTSPQKQELPDIIGTFPLDTNSKGSGKIGGVFSYDGTTCGDWSGHKTGTGCLVNFSTAESNSIYNGSNVIPGNYAAYIFIYAGQ